MRSQAILRTEYGPGLGDALFTDDLGQLLVKRTILYLYAREDRMAWDTLKRDGSRYYQTSARVPQLQQEIYKLLRANPY